jgi:L-asparaginase
MDIDTIGKWRVVSRLRVLATGGTIASRFQDGRGIVAADDARTLLDHLVNDHQILFSDVMTVGSYRLGLAELRTIAEAVATALAGAVDDDDVDGVVVTHGTDTLEETAFLLDLVHDSQKNVVLTGAQIPADGVNSDGPRNLKEALEVAACQELNGSGALISFGGVVRSARGARKAHTMALNPFAGGTEVAHMREDTLVVTASPSRRRRLPPPPAAFDSTRVEIITAYPGATTALLDFAVSSGAAAIVLAGSGAGNAGPGFAEAVRNAVESGCQVVLSSRVPWGPIVPTYGNGGGADLVDAGAVPSGDLNPFQARILTALLLSLDTKSEDFRDVFTQFI